MRERTIRAELLLHTDATFTPGLMIQRLSVFHLEHFDVTKNFILTLSWI